MGMRWKQYEAEGKWVYEQHPFWCTGYTFVGVGPHSYVYRALISVHSGTCIRRLPTCSCISLAQA